MAEVVLYQIINMDAEEIYFGVTDLELDKEVERLAKIPNGPISHWEQGQTVYWRPLTMKIDETIAKSLHEEIQKKTPPNKYTVIQG